MPLPTLLGATLLASEFALTLARHASASESGTHDRATFRRLWIVISLACFSAGLAVSFGSWLALPVLMVPVTFVIAQRIAVEEHALAGAFGAEWDAYASRTRRLVPGLY